MATSLRLIDTRCGSLSSATTTHIATCRVTMLLTGDKVVDCEQKGPMQGLAQLALNLSFILRVHTLEKVSLHYSEDVKPLSINCATSSLTMCNL